MVAAGVSPYYPPPSFLLLLFPLQQRDLLGFDVMDNRMFPGPAGSSQSSPPSPISGPRIPGLYGCRRLCGGSL